MVLLVLFFCLVVVVADMDTYYQTCQTLPRDSLLPCFSSLIDTNSDGKLNHTEVLNFLESQNMTTVVQNVIMSVCDTNGDSLLDLVDWNATNACVQSRPIIARVCYACANAGWVP